MDKLIASSPKTLGWLNKIRAEIKQRYPSLEYKECKYYAPFRSPERNRNIVQVNPQKNQIRVFLTLDPSFDLRLQPTPSTSYYGKNFPSLFVIKDESMVEKAIKLIIASYQKKKY